MINIQIGDQIQRVLITQLFEEGNQCIMRRWCNELLVGNSWSDTKNFSKEFNTNLKLLIVKLKLVRRRILDLGNSEPELLHVDLKNINSGKECIVAWRKLENIENNLICGFLLLLGWINPHVARANLNSLVETNASSRAAC
ncbi:hypothetical protein Tco_0853986 [Tanacetum coccineum]